jgi:ribosomal protein L29
MNRITKFLLVSFLLLSSLSFAQKVEILIVGSSHDNKPGFEKYDQVINKLKSFKPDMVFGEYVSPADYKALEPGTWGYQSLKKSEELVKGTKQESDQLIERRIQKAIQSLNKFPYYHKVRMDLARDYILLNDKANAEYQVFLIETEMKKGFGKEELEYYTQRFVNADTLKKLRLFRPSSEYTNIFFPMMYALKQDKIYAMDCQKYDKPWNMAWAKADSAIKLLEKKAKADSLSPEANTLKAIEKYSDYSEDDKKKMTPSPYFNMASPRYSELNDAWNFYGGRHFYGYAGFPDQEIKAMYAQWNLRNEGMSANVLRQVKERKAKRVLIAVGAAHRKIMEEILSKDPNVSIVTYSSL